MFKLDPAADYGSMSTLSQQLRDFLMHEHTPVDSIIAPYALETVFNEITALLEGGDAKAIIHVLGFVRDASLYPHPFHDTFREHLNSSPVWENFRRLLQYPNFGVRGSVIYTIGKLGYRNQSCLLSEAFPFFLEKDPINLPRLLSEIVWLTQDWPWSFLEGIAAADHYLRRWSLCEILDDNGASPETLIRFAEILSTLKADQQARVAAEANLRFERIKVKLGPKLEKAEWRKQVKRLAGLEPTVTFERAGLQFMRDRQDYTLDEFDNFVASSNLNLK